MGTAPSLPCPICGARGDVVPLTLVRHHASQPWRRDLDTRIWRFCANAGCPLIYFGSEDIQLTVEDVRRPPSYKTGNRADLICFCFDATGADLLGPTDPVPYISIRVAQGECACDVLNPSGECCLGSIGRWRKREGPGV